MRGASIQIGVGALVAGIVGFWNDAAAFALLILVGVVLISHGVYEDFVKPRFRVEHRLHDWLQRRGWSVRIERLPQFNFALHITSADSSKQILVSRNKDARDDVLAFTAKVGLHPDWLEPLRAMKDDERKTLLSDITIYLSAKNLSLDLSQRDAGSRSWPPSVVIQTALPQDHTLSQHSVDMTAKSIELSMIGVRDLIRKAVIPVQARLRETSSEGAPNAPQS
ncbi:MAG TPA: DUF2299 family protein [Dehalococcoidia bacterium]|nr:DUF2299 family protein [Dehalococcoidia bacterium]